MENSKSPLELMEERINFSSNNIDNNNDLVKYE